MMGVSGRAMIEALIDGERRGRVLADLARGVLRSKIPDLSMALTGRFNDHHALMCRLHLRHVDELTELTGTVDKQADALMFPFAAERDLLMSIPGIGRLTAGVIISENGTDMSFFPSADHPASRAGLAPASNESGGRRRPAGTRHGNQHLANVLIESAWSCSRTRTRPGAQFHRLVRRFGGHRNSRAKKKAAVAVAHTLILIIYCVLDRHLPYDELGEDSCTRRQDPERHKDKLIARLGCKVTVEPAQAA
jgi:transposase